MVDSGLSPSAFDLWCSESFELATGIDARLQRRGQPAKHWPQHSRSGGSQKGDREAYGRDILSQTINLWEDQAFSWFTIAQFWRLQVPCKLRPGLDDELDGVAAREDLRGLGGARLGAEELLRLEGQP